MNYISTGIKGLQNLMNWNVQQVLFNKNYGKRITDYRIKTHTDVDEEFVVHDYNNDISLPHFRLQPSIINVKALLSIGNFDCSETLMSERYYLAGYKSAFLIN